MTEIPIIGSRVTIAASRAGPLSLNSPSSSIEPARARCMVKTAVLGQAVAVRVERCLGQDIASRVQQFNSPRIPTCVAEKKSSSAFFFFSSCSRHGFVVWAHNLSEPAARQPTGF